MAVSNEGGWLVMSLSRAGEFELNEKMTSFREKLAVGSAAVSVFA